MVISDVFKAVEFCLYLILKTKQLLKETSC